MTSNALPPLSLGTMDFATLRKSGQIYIDKTELVYEIASFPGKYFLNRPRHFGKTLLLTTFESLFKFGLRDFQGLAIEKLWDDEEEYHVLKLDFSRLRRFTYLEDFSSGFDDYLEEAFASIGFVKKADGMPTMLQIELFIQNLPLSSLVLLIDNYDAPITECIYRHVDFKEVAAALSDFYSMIKSQDGAIRFLFLTGVSHFDDSSIFSGMNNLCNLSLDPTYAQILGFSEGEILESFGGYLKKACFLLRTSEENLLNHLRDYYGGYCFDEQASLRVCNPWSIMNFLQSPKRGFRNYWFNNGGKKRIHLDCLKSILRKSPMAFTDFVSEEYLCLYELILSSEPKDVNLFSFLTLAGYFTIKRLADVDTAILGCPNREVAQSMAKLCAGQLLHGKTLAQIGADHAARRLATEPPESMVHLLNRIFLSLDPDRCPIRLASEVQKLVQVFLCGEGLLPRPLEQSGLGVSAGGRFWLLEFKVKRPGENEERLFAEALEQIGKRKYGEQHGAEKLIRLALLFSVEERQFVRWADLSGDPLQTDDHKGSLSGCARTASASEGRPDRG